MGIETAEDLAVFFDVAEHAVEATYDGSTVKGIFQAAFLPVEVGGYQEIEGTAPRFTCVEDWSDLQTESGATLETEGGTTLEIEGGKALVIGGVTYRITGTEPDGTGLVTLVLQKG